MTQAILTPKYVNAPKPGKKMGSIKDQAGILWLCDPGLLTSFSPGRPATVEAETVKFNDGTVMQKITGIVHGAEPATNGAAHHGNERQPNAGREIFITGIVGRAMGSGQFAIADITALTAAAAAAWDTVVVSNDKPTIDKPRADATLNDDIPF